MKQSIHKVAQIFSFIAALIICFSFTAAHAESKLEGKININTANVHQLVLLPGVGEKKAIQIIQARKNKPFKSFSDLMEVKGIGAKSIERWKALIVFDGPTTIQAK